MSWRWMYADAGVGWLASKNPLRWSEWLAPAVLARSLESADVSRPVVIEAADGAKLGPLSVVEAIARLGTLATHPEEQRARAMAAAEARLPAFMEAAKAALEKESKELAKHYGHRADGFYLRFLQFNEVLFGGRQPEMALTMLLNYACFMQSQREQGRLAGLGADMLRPHMSNVRTPTSTGGFVRVLRGTARDRAGRRLVLTVPADLDEKVASSMRTKLYIYWFVKFACLEDTMAPGWCIVHDLSGVTLEKAVSRLLGGSEAKEVLAAASKPTFPWMLSKIVFVNAPGWLRTSLGLVTPLLPPAAKAKMQILGDLADGAHAAALDAIVARAQLPAEPPYHGGVNEAWDAALCPGLGDFYETEMDPAEACAPRM